MKILNQVCILLAIIVSLTSPQSPSHETTQPQKKQLQFDENGEFKILVVTDLHLGDEDLAKDLKTTQLLKKMIEGSKPDFVIVTGDLVTGYHWDGSSKDFYASNWRKFHQVMEETKTFYAYALGNHDGEADTNNEGIFELESQSPWSLSERGPPNIHGVSNYVIHVKSRLNTTADFHPATILWVFDSNKEGCNGVVNSHGCVEPDQVRWYEEKSLELESKYGNEANIDHMAFFHIPLEEHMIIWNEVAVTEGKGEAVTCPKYDTGLLDKMVERGDVSAIFAGHDHDNYYDGELDGIELFYVPKSGYGLYGDPRGGRLIKLFEERKEQGEIVVRKEHYRVDLEGRVWSNHKRMHREEGKQYECAYGDLEGFEIKLLRFFGF